MGFWSGFAQGWEAESERIERRKLFFDEQKERRMGTLAEIMARRQASGGGGGGSGGGTTGVSDVGSVDHNTDVLLNYNVDPDTIASVTAKGPKALQVMVDTISETAKNPAALTPTTFQSIADSIVSTVNSGETVDPKSLAAEYLGEDFAGSLTEEDVKYLDLLAGPTDTNEVSSTYVPAEPYDVNKANQIISTANETLRGAVAQELAVVEDQISQLPTDAAESQTLSDRARDLNTALLELKEGNPVGAIQAFGQDKAYNIIAPYLEQDPELANAPAGLLGVWGNVVPRSFGSYEEAQAAIDRNELQEGQMVRINGKVERVTFGD